MADKRHHGPPPERLYPEKMVKRLKVSCFAGTGYRSVLTVPGHHILKSGPPSAVAVLGHAPGRYENPSGLLSFRAVTGKSPSDTIAHRAKLTGSVIFQIGLRT